MVGRGFVVDMIFLDFSKAFIVVNRSIILTKLQMLGIGGKLAKSAVSHPVDTTLSYN